jgi:hypothetical protein
MQQGHPTQLRCEGPAPIPPSGAVALGDHRGNYPSHRWNLAGHLPERPRSLGSRPKEARPLTASGCGSVPRWLQALEAEADSPFEKVGPLQALGPVTACAVLPIVSRDPFQTGSQWPEGNARPSGNDTRRTAAVAEWIPRNRPRDPRSGSACRAADRTGCTLKASEIDTFYSARLPPPRAFFMRRQRRNRRKAERRDASPNGWADIPGDL